MEKIITLAMATRLKRKIFLAKGISSDFEILIRNISSEQGWNIIDLKILPYGFIMTISSAVEINHEFLSKKIRYATSSYLRDKYMQLWKMPSTWTKKYFIYEGMMDEELDQKINNFFDTIKSR